MTAGAVSVPTIIPLRAPVPGQPKTSIDTNTKIELHSDTQNVVIYYTINGERPEPNQTIGPAAKATFAYREPFTVPGGKRIIKAIAVSADGRESSIVTKAFDVQSLPSVLLAQQSDEFGFINDIPANEMAKREVSKFVDKMVTGKEAWAEVQKMKAVEDALKGADGDFHGLFTDKRKPPNGPRYLNSRLNSSRSANGHNKDHCTTNGKSAEQWLKKWKRQAPDDATSALRLQRETDFLKCIYCFAPRPSDPFVRFCNECGSPIPPLPQTRLPPPEPGQMGTCISCKTVVPFNSPNCLVCEAPLGPQSSVPQAALKLGNKILCTKCGTANPPGLHSCIVCEASLPDAGMLIQQNFSHGPHGTFGGGAGGRGGGGGPGSPVGRMMTCSKCGRVNSPEARFCDWCGTKPSAALPTPLVCSKCRGSNSPYAQFCGSCGEILSAPVRTDARNGHSVQFVGSTAPMINGSRTEAQWMPSNVVAATSFPRNDATTQTVGLFYPSEKKLHLQNHDLSNKLSIEKEMRDRKPMLTAISPGRGYWRKQMEHICGHLKVHAANSADFRALIGEPRMGKLLSATVHEDGYELSLTVNFALRGTSDSDSFVGKPVGVTRDLLSSYSTRQRADSLASQDSLDFDRDTSRSTKSQKKSARKPRQKKVAKKVTEEDTLSPTDKKLLKELGKNGEGRASEVSELVQEGADPNCVNKDGVPVLHVAALNKHVEALPVLIQEGADVNCKGPNKGNTALHEVISLGPVSIPVIEQLLGCGANPNKKNSKGETAYDIAVKSGYDSVAKKLSTSIAQSTLDKLVKPRSTQSDDDDI